jgi:hypothetical protein
MWTLPLIAASVVLAQPAPDAFVEVGCPWTPLFFGGRTTEIDASGREYAIGSWAALMTTGPAAGEVRVLLRAYTTPPRPNGLADVSAERLEAARAALIARGVPADRILLGSYPVDRQSDQAPEGWVGGYVFPEFYFTRAAALRMFPPGGAIC